VLRSLLRSMLRSLLLPVSSWSPRPSCRRCRPLLPLPLLPLPERGELLLAAAALLRLRQQLEQEASRARQHFLHLHRLLPPRLRWKPQAWAFSRPVEERRF
jgi:hypothetical protein